MRLSICIPTYNRSPYLEVLLDSILSQRDYRCSVEIVISDNASTDATDQLVERYRPLFDGFVYQKAETNQGADRNFMKVVELATGDYCWLMGSDDRLEPGGIRHIEDAIASNPDAGGLSVRSLSYNLAMDALIPSAGADGIFPQTTAFDGTEEIFERLGSYTGFLSGNVVRRDLWNEAVERYDMRPFFNGWVHVYVIGRIMQLHPRWVYVAQPCVGWRSGNDSFLSNGMYRRLEIDVVGFDEIVRALFGAGSRAHRDTLRQSLPHARHRILHAKAFGAETDFFRKSHRLMVGRYWRSAEFWATCYPVFLLPSSFFKVARKIRLRLSASRGH